MVIFKYEIRNHAKYIFTWAIALAACIFLMIPVYYSLLNGAESSAIRSMKPWVPVTFSRASAFPWNI